MRATYQMAHSIRTTFGCQFFLLIFGIHDGFPTAHLRNLGPTSLLDFRTRNYFIHRAVSSKSDSTNAPGCELMLKVLPARILPFSTSSAVILGLRRLKEFFLGTTTAAAKRAPS